MEKPTEDQIQEKSSDKGLKTSETDEAKEKEVGQAASNEDLVPAPIESKNLGPQQPGEPKEDVPAEDNVVPTEAVEPQQEASVNTPDTEKPVSGGQEMEKEEKQEEKTNDLNKEEEQKEMEEENDHLETDREDQIEDGAEKSSGLEEQPKDAPEQPESVKSGQEEKKEESEGPEEVSSPQEVAEDTTDSGVVNKVTEKIESDLKETSASEDADTKLRAVEAPAAAPTEEEQEETTKEQEEEKNDSKAPEETVLPQEEPAPAASINTVSDVVSETSQDIEPVTLRREEEAARVDHNSCQDAVSVPESETDSESKTDQGSPAVVKADVEKDSDSGSSSAADNSSLDLNLSISSFLSKSKEGGSVSMQVS